MAGDVQKSVSCHLQHPGKMLHKSIVSVCSITHRHRFWVIITEPGDRQQYTGYEKLIVYLSVAADTYESLSKYTAAQKLVGV